MVVLDELRSVNNVNIGNPIVVTLSNPQFQVNADGLPVPSTLQVFLKERWIHRSYCQAKQ